MHISEPKRFTEGLTLTRVLVAVATAFAALGAIVGLTGPMRERHRQTVCASHLRDLYMATCIYTADYPGPEDLYGVPPSPISRELARKGGSLMTRGVAALLPYLKSRDSLECPDLPPMYSGMLRTTYVWWLRRPDPVTPPDENEFRALAQQDDEIAKRGHNFPMWVCTIHDEAYYRPKEANVSGIVREEYVLEVSFSGSIYIGRRPYTLSDTISALKSIAELRKQRINQQ